MLTRVVFRPGQKGSGNFLGLLRAFEDFLGLLRASEMELLLLF